MDSDNQLDSELESFRRQWISDLRSKSDVPACRKASRQPGPSSPSSSRAPPQKRPPPEPSSSGPRPAAPVGDDEEYVRRPSFDELPPPAGRTLADPEAPAGKGKELVSALDHFEEAMEREAQGNMGDSLKLYRKAYRLDHAVDRRYREKHFPPSNPVPKSTTASGAPEPAAPTTTSSNSQQQPPPQDPPERKPLSLDELITSFSTLKIEPAPPIIEGDIPQPCPISSLPDELLVHILQDVAVTDVGDFMRLAQVCKHLAYLATTEQRIWRRVCVGAEYGFAGMHRQWNTSIDWKDSNPGTADTGCDEDADPGVLEEDSDGTLIGPVERTARRQLQSFSDTLSLVPSQYNSWQNMFRSRPRLRFNGCYISTVNYVRSGQASTNQSTWGSPIHIVTYYRYLRFFRDGAVISLLTTTEPTEVVHHMTRDLLLLHRDASAHVHLPSAVMHHALRGRWRLFSAEENDREGGAGATPPASSHAEREARLVIETEGVGPKYIHRMDLALRTAGKAARNNKIIWSGFHSYNKLTDDWGEFGLKNDKPFFFSRVKSYGFGE